MADYIYSSTFLRAIEKYLLDTTDIQRMVGTKDVKETTRVLEDTNYAKDFKGLISKTKPEDYRDILSDDLEKAKKILHSLTQDKALIKFTFSFFDFHNIKLFYKEKFSRKEMNEFVSLHGSQDPTELKKAILESKKANIDIEFQALIENADRKFAKNKNPYFIDTYLDKKRIEVSLAWAKEIGSEWISSYVKRKIDILNLQNVVRLYWIGRSEKIKETIIEEGSVKDWEFLNLCSDIKEVLLTIKNSFDKKIQKIIDNYLEDKNLWKFVKALDNDKIEYLRTAKFINWGPEIIVSYFLARINANRNVRIIMEGKLNELKNEEIEERVRIPF